MKHTIDHKTNARHQPGLGTVGESYYMMDFESAVEEYDLPRAKRCPVCSYDRCEVHVDHNPELGDTVEARCGACGCELESAVRVRSGRG